MYLSLFFGIISQKGVTLMNFFVNDNQIIDEEIYIKGMDVNHIKNVLRYKENDELNVVCKTRILFFFFVSY